MQGFLCVWNTGMWGRRTPLHSTFVDHRTQTVFTLMSSIFSFTIFVNSLKIKAKIPASQTSDPKHPKIRKRWVKGQRGNSWPWHMGHMLAATPPFCTKSASLASVSSSTRRLTHEGDSLSSTGEPTQACTCSRAQKLPHIVFFIKSLWIRGWRKNWRLTKSAFVT